MIEAVGTGHTSYNSKHNIADSYISAFDHSLQIRESFLDRLGIHSLLYEPLDRSFLLQRKRTF